MNLEEFILYCTLKGIISNHQKLQGEESEWTKGLPAGKLVIRQKPYRVLIAYVIDNGEYEIIYSSLQLDTGSNVETYDMPDLNMIVSRIIPNES